MQLRSPAPSFATSASMRRPRRPQLVARAAPPESDEPAPRQPSLQDAQRLERLYSETEADKLARAKLSAELSYRRSEAEETCAEAPAEDCSAAWDVVGELRESVARRFPPPPREPSPPSNAPPMPSRGLADPLAGVSPASRIGTLREPPSGSLRAAASLERLASGSSAEKRPPASREAVQAALEEAVATAAACGEGGESPAECAAAWDQVEELSAESAHRRDA